jgi:hypothetical protein
MSVNLVCPRCNKTCFRFLFGCEHDGACYFPNLGKFDAYAYAHRGDNLKNSPIFEKYVMADWDRIFGEMPE